MRTAASGSLATMYRYPPPPAPGNLYPAVYIPPYPRHVLSSHAGWKDAAPNSGTSTGQSHPGYSLPRG
jgi:hypothetical protein